MDIGLAKDLRAFPSGQLLTDGKTGFSMVKRYDVERAKALAVEAIAICDEAGLELPAAHLQHALDMLQGFENRVREERAGWGADTSDGDPKPTSQDES